MSNLWKVSLVIILAIALLASGTAIGLGLNGTRFQFADFPWNQYWNGMNDWMHGHGGLGGMMDGYRFEDRPIPQNKERLSLNDALEIAEGYLGEVWGSAIEIAEIMEFDNHFYIQAVETNTGINAFEFLMDPITAAIHPEPGPNMMWNTKYGMMGGRGMMGGYGMVSGSRAVPANEMAISPQQAREIAQEALNSSNPTSYIDEEVDVFYGYYTLHTLQDGEVTGMLSVNAETGQVWLHTWHGDFVDMLEHSHS